MCLINIKPAGKSWKDKIFLNAIHTGFETQRDLSGFGYYQASTGKVFIDKPYATATDMLYTIKNIITDDDILVIHHRQATDGEVNSVNCHPIPIKIKGSNVDPELRITGNVDCPILFHNGILQHYCTSKIFSDSYLFAQEFLTQDGIIDKIYEDPIGFSFDYKNILLWNKFAMLRPGYLNTKPLVLFGSDFIEDEGFYFSNNVYKKVSNLYLFDKVFNSEKKEIVVEDEEEDTSLIFSPIMPKEYDDKVKERKAKRKESKNKKTKLQTAPKEITLDNLSELFVDDFNKDYFQIECLANSVSTANPNRKVGRLFDIKSTSLVGEIVGKFEEYNATLGKYVEINERFYMASLWTNGLRDTGLYCLRLKPGRESWYEKVLQFIKIYPTLSKNLRKRITKFLDNPDNYKSWLNVPNYSNFEFTQMSEALSQLNWLTDRNNDTTNHNLTTLYKKYANKKFNDVEMTEEDVEIDRMFGPSAYAHNMFN